MSIPLVSVVVPCYNYGQYLAEALDSVLRQSYTNWECIIVNDGSPDNTEEVALDFCKKDTRFTYIKKENNGVGAARNTGIKMSSGIYVLPFDADDVISNNYLKESVHILETVNDVIAVAAKMQLFGLVNEVWKRPAYNLKSLLLVNSLCTAFMFSRKNYDRVGGYDESMVHGFEDWDFWISMLKNGGTIYELPSIIYYYRQKDGSLFKELVKDRNKSFESLLKLYNNQIDVYQKYFDSPITLIQENEKLNRVINSYKKTRTHKWGLTLFNIKNFILKSLKIKSIEKSN